jgi:hypothetical protein
VQERLEGEHPCEELHREQHRDDGHVVDRGARRLVQDRQREPNQAHCLDHVHHPRERVGGLVRRRHAQVRRHLRSGRPPPSPWPWERAGLGREVRAAGDMGLRRGRGSGQATGVGLATRARDGRGIAAPTRRLAR